MKDNISKSLTPRIYVPGSYDLLNIGHIRLFKYAYDYAQYSYVIAGVSTDKLILSYKFLKPICPLKERIELVSACKYVDRVIIQKKFFDIEQLKKLNIDYVLLGSDWENKDFPALMYAQGMLKFKIIYKPYTKEVSSSEIKRRIIKNAYDIVKAEGKRQ